MSSHAPEKIGFELSVPAIAENVALVRHAFGGLGTALDLPDSLVADIKLAVTEACTNVVVHAYPNGDGQLDIATDIDGDLLTIVVSDDGVGLRARVDSPGAGLGLPMIATLANSLELDAGTDERTQVRMTFDIAAATGSK